MGRQLRIMQTPQDVEELWAAIPNKLNVAAIPRRMESRPERFWRPGEIGNDALLLFCASDWEALLAAVVPGEGGFHQLSPRLGVVEWSPTEVGPKHEYIVGARIYIQEDADVPSSAGAAKIYDWMSRWMKARYYLAPAPRAPIAIGPHLVADIKVGRATAVYPSGKSVI